MNRRRTAIVAALLCLSAFAAFPQATIFDLQAQVEKVYDIASDSVVNITSQVMQYNYFYQAVPQEGTGSGFVYDAQGHIVTNNHVIEGADSITVTLMNGKVFKAKVTGQDPQNDLAVIQINGTGIPEPLSIADSSQLSVGQFVIALGSPFRLQGTLTFGVISALGRNIQSPDGEYISEAIQTDAAVNPGNSGGPLLDLQGRVIGINSQILSPSGASSGIGFAVSSRTIQRVVPLLISRGSYPHPYLGVNGLALTSDIIQAYSDAGMPVRADSGYLIWQVGSGSPADKAGVHGGVRARIGRSTVYAGGDVIVAINGTPIANEQDLSLYLEDKTKVGDTVTVTVMRGGRRMDLKVTLAEEPERK
jgi:S1-C subfamily serine protease